MAPTADRTRERNTLCDIPASFSAARIDENCRRPGRKPENDTFRKRPGMPGYDIFFTQPGRLLMKSAPNSSHRDCRTVRTVLSDILSADDARDVRTCSTISMRRVGERSSSKVSRVRKKCHTWHAAPFRKRIVLRLRPGRLQFSVDSCGAERAGMSHRVFRSRVRSAVGAIRSSPGSASRCVVRWGLFTPSQAAGVGMEAVAKLLGI